MKVKRRAVESGRMSLPDESTLWVEEAWDVLPQASCLICGIKVNSLLECLHRDWLPTYQFLIIQVNKDIHSEIVDRRSKNRMCYCSPTDVREWCVVVQVA